ncbi:unnamed protein product [Durusdinium trenchii]|uniref:WW domain-containing protein n=1 Tax=Durusdinium trenchii TaxID=1381693 RepID=A0ABP0MQ00_9DINO
MVHRGSVVIFSVCAALLVRLDLYLPLQHLVLAGILNTLPPMIAGVSLILNMLTLDGKSAYWKLLGDSLVPAAFFLHILWLGLLLVWAKGKVINNIYLPTIFRAVLYLDVFGWLSSEDRQESRTLTGAAEDPENTADSFSGLSVVQEEEPSQPSRLRIPGSDGRRQSLRDSLAKLCSEMKSDLEKDLKCFEAEDVSSIMEPYEKQAIQELRQQLNDTVASVRLEEPGEATDESKPVWVRLEWNPSGRASYFYRQVRPEDPKVVWTRPLPPDQVLELEELRTRLEGLKKKVEMLASHFQDEQVTISFDASSCRSSNNSGEAEQLSHWPESASAGESHPAQDQTQAASEAVQLAESAAAMQAQAGAGFHPHQPRADTRPGPDRHQEPGLLPWTTVKQGSLILISAWGIGLVWSILRLWTDVVDILDPPKKPDNPDLELLFDGPWPRYFQPRGLACDERDRDEAPRILIAEKHEVHQLLQEEHWTLSTSSMEAACLSTQPRFHASGLRGISLQCAHEGCESVLVGEGSRALRCGGNETAELKLHGGPWHLATSLDQGVWATRPAESSPVLLHPGSDGWVPALQLAEHPAASDQRLLDRLQDGGLLAMSHAGRIHAWQPQASSSSWLPSGWSYDLPDDLGLSWTGLCTAGSSLILLGQAAGKVEVWRLSLPALRGSA